MCAASSRTRALGDEAAQEVGDLEPRVPSCRSGRVASRDGRPVRALVLNLHRGPSKQRGARQAIATGAARLLREAAAHRPPGALEMCRFAGTEGQRGYSAAIRSSLAHAWAWRAYGRRMTSGPARRSHEEFARVLRRAGCSDEFISEVLSQLPDPIDLQRDQQILARYGLSSERLMDRMGGSP
jgi:hypothetical protein